MFALCRVFFLVSLIDVSCNDGRPGSETSEALTRAAETAEPAGTKTPRAGLPSLVAEQVPNFLSSQEGTYQNFNHREIYYCQ